MLNVGVSNTPEMSYEFLYRYVEMRQKVDTEANSIRALSSILALVESCGDDSINVDPLAFSVMLVRLRIMVS